MDQAIEKELKELRSRRRATTTLVEGDVASIKGVLSRLPSFHFYQSWDARPIFADSILTLSLLGQGGSGIENLPTCAADVRLLMTHCDVLERWRNGKFK